VNYANNLFLFYFLK